MNFTGSKDDDKYIWTNHVKDKMLYYGISPSLVKRIVRFPQRKQEGIAPQTTAVMQSRVSTSRSRGKSIEKIQETWVMYQQIGQRPTAMTNYQFPMTNPKVRIISAWRYPGRSPAGKSIPIPDDMLIEIEQAMKES